MKLVYIIALEAMPKLVGCGFESHLGHMRRTDILKMKKVIIRYNDLALRVIATEDNTNIEDSYRVKNYLDMVNILTMIQEECDSSLAINKRGLCGMVNEWRVHNLLYSLGIQRDRTKSVDLNIGQPWYVKVAYFLISPLYLHFS